jgi:hypothetical protein
MANDLSDYIKNLSRPVGRLLVFSGLVFFAQLQLALAQN